MQLPAQNRHYQIHVAYGRYAAGRLRQAKLEALAAEVETANANVKDKGRAWEDASESVTTHAAQRDALDDALDGAAQEFRLKIAARYVGADRALPYTGIFPKGVGYYTASPLAENASRYRELLTRAEAQLKADDADFVALKATVPALLESWQPALTALTEARTQAGVARTALETAIDSWLVQLERTYGTLVAQLGRRKADRFFPRTNVAPSEDPAPEPPSAPQ